ncbi:MAG: DUF4363 family protein [Oscillospiraceae bacterium]|nr:DUF4363 family protein [Oscillospiraceae bacterium]
MKRVKLAVCIIAVILFVGSFSVVYTYNTAALMTDMLEQIRTSAMAEDEKYTAKLCGEYNAEWQKRERILSRLLRHHPIDGINQLSAQLETFAEHEEKIMLLATVDQLEEGMRHLWEEECPNPLNIL